MIIEVASNGGEASAGDRTFDHAQMVLGESSGGEEPPAAAAAPKKRAETWVQEETRSLIALRRETDGLFNTSKSNKHLWDQISAKMRDRGFDRSPTMCTDKWRNLLKEFKKAKHHQDRSASAKMSYYKEIDEILRDRGKNSQYKSPTPPPPANTAATVPAEAKVDSFMQFSDKGFGFESERFQFFRVLVCDFCCFDFLCVCVVGLAQEQVLTIRAFLSDKWKVIMLWCLVSEKTLLLFC